MCHRRCKYEDTTGECTLSYKNIPNDSDCMIHEREIDLYEDEKLKLKMRQRFYLNTRNYLLKRIELAGI